MYKIKLTLNGRVSTWVNDDENEKDAAHRLLTALIQAEMKVNHSGTIRLHLFVNGVEFKQEGSGLGFTLRDSRP